MRVAGTGAGCGFDVSSYMNLSVNNCSFVQGSFNSSSSAAVCLLAGSNATVSNSTIAARPGNGAMQAQIAALQEEAAALRQRVGHIEADLADLNAQIGRRNPRRSSSDRAKAAAGGGRQ